MFSSVQSHLRVEFLLKTDSGYPRDAEVTLFTLENPEHFLRFNTHWSAPPSGFDGVRYLMGVEFLLKTDGGWNPKDTGWQPLGILSAITPIGQLHQSSPSPIPGDLGRCPSHQSHVLEHRDTYGQAQWQWATSKKKFCYFFLSLDFPAT